MFQCPNPTMTVFYDEFNARRENEELYRKSPLLVNFDANVMTIPQALYNTQAAFGGRPANMYKEDGEWKVLPYNDLVYRVENIAIGLIKLGIQSGDILGIKGHTCARWAWSDLGTLFAGAATASIHATLSQRETTMIANHSENRLIFTDTPERLFDLLSYRNDMPTVDFFVCMEKGFTGNGKDVWGLNELMAMGEESRDTMLDEVKARVAALTGDSPGAMVYTSGTTGDLKGVMHSHKSLCYGCTRSALHYFNCGHMCYNIVHMCVLPLSHIVEKCHSYYAAIVFGGCMGFAESPATLINDYQVIRPTFQMFVPRLLNRIILGIQNAYSATPEGKQLWDWAMDVAVRTTYAIANEDGNINTNIPIPQQLADQPQLQQEWIQAYNMVYWRVHHVFGGRMYDMNCGGAALDPNLHRKLLGMGFFVGYGYGLTETCAGINQAPPNASKPGWSSQPNPGVEVRLDEDGEFLLKGNGIVTEYYKNPQATKESFTEDGFFRTGDIGEISPEGYMRVVDRKKSLIILDTGKNVPVSKIEFLCEGTGLIDQVVVTGQDKKYVGALIVPNFDAILGAMDKAGVPYDKDKVKYGILNGLRVCLEVGDDVLENEIVRDTIAKQIEKVNSQLESYETIKKYKVLNKRFTEASGEVTASQKLRIKIINEKYREDIESLY